MSPALIVILAVGVGLAYLVVTSRRNLRNDIRERLAMRERLRETVTGRRVSGDAG